MKLMFKKVSVAVVSSVALLLVEPAHAAAPTDCPAATVAGTEALAGRWPQALKGDALDDVNVVDDLLVEDYIHHSGFDQPMIEGREAYKRFLEDNFTGDIFTDPEVTTDQIIATKDRAAVSWTVTALYQEGQGGTVEADTPVTWSGITLVRVECGRIAEAWVEADNLYRLQQMGTVPLEIP